jgi:hypothetical protein
MVELLLQRGADPAAAGAPWAAPLAWAEKKGTRESLIGCALGAGRASASENTEDPVSSCTLPRLVRILKDMVNLVRVHGRLD